MPEWAAFHNLLLETNKVPEYLTVSAALPLIPFPPHEWPTLLTTLKQAQNIITQLSGGLKVISLDTAWYEKAIQLTNSHLDLKEKYVIHLGELHACMAIIRAIGTAIENSGLDDAWTEPNIYGPAIVRQILSCNHYKRAVAAHMITYMSLARLLFKEFLVWKPLNKSV